MGILKRGADLLMAFIAIVVLLPVCLVLAALILIETPGPVFFLQRRMGKDRRPFNLYKFRSMVVNDVPPVELGEVKHNHYLVTRVGHFMRRTKLDEVPQFLNVLRGEMSLVGPRPGLIERVNESAPLEIQRLRVRPGMTSWADTNGNVEIEWGERLWMDMWYLDNYSIWLDIKILFKTLYVVVFGSKRNEAAVIAARQHQIGVSQKKPNIGSIQGQQH